MMKRMNEEAAENVAIGALGVLASDAERVERFLGLTGLTPQTLREAAADPRFLASLLDYVMGDEALLLDCAGQLDVAPDAFPAARAALAGDDVMDDV